MSFGKGGFAVEPEGACCFIHRRMTVWDEDRLELALRASKEGIWDWSLERETMVYSAWVLRFLDYRRKDMPHLFKDREKIMDEASAAAVEEALQEVRDEESDLFAVEPRAHPHGAVEVASPPRDTCARSVSYTHLTLPTTPYV